MKVKALKNFAGIVSMHKGQVKEVKDDIAKGLAKGGLVEAVSSPKKSTKKGE